MRMFYGAPTSTPKSNLDIHELAARGIGEELSMPTMSSSRQRNLDTRYVASAISNDQTTSGPVSITRIARTPPGKACLRDFRAVLSLVRLRFRIHVKCLPGYSLYQMVSRPSRARIALSDVTMGDDSTFAVATIKRSHGSASFDRSIPQ